MLQASKEREEMKTVDKSRGLRSMLPGRKIGDKKRRGALSLEMMGIIAIIGVLVMSGLYYLNIMMRDTKVNDMVSAIQMINTKVAEMYNNEANYNGLSAKMLIDAGNVPTSLVDGTRAGLKSPWGAMTLAPVAGPENGGAETAYTLTLEGVPGDVCRRLTTSMRRATAWYSISTGGTEFKLDPTNTENMTNWANQECGDDGNKKTVIFTSNEH